MHSLIHASFHPPTHPPTRYPPALDLYLKAYRNSPHEPLVSLCAGTLALRGSMNRRVQDRHSVIAKAFAFLFEYARLRVPGEDVTLQASLFG